jgi:hypothetical protein
MQTRLPHLSPTPPVLTRPKGVTGRLLNAHFIELTWVNSSGGDNVQNLHGPDNIEVNCRAKCPHVVGSVLGGDR